MQDKEKTDNINVWRNHTITILIAYVSFPLV